jgi:hypothetical protein
MPEAHDAIDLDDEDSWPDASREWAERVAHRLAGSTEYLLDLSIELKEEDQFRRTLGSRRVLAYHCTRLLSYEVDDVRNQGLRPLTEQLVRQRVAAADARGLLSDAVRRRALSGNVFALGNARSRTDRTCLVVGRSIFDEDPHGLIPLLRHWGGEAIRDGPSEQPLLANLGVPTIVAATLDLTRPHDDPHSFPPLANLFVGTMLGLEQRAAEIHYRRPITGDAIHAIWQPGDPEYDRHPQLPTDR